MQLIRQVIGWMVAGSVCFAIDTCKELSYISGGEGPFILKALVPVLSSAPSRFRNVGLLFSEAIKYSINEVNLKFFQKELLSYEIFDSCGETTFSYTTQVGVDIILSNTQNTRILDNHCLCHEDLQIPLYLGIVGPDTSTTTIHLNKILGDIPIPVLSYISTSSKLSDKAAFPNFFRTISPDRNYVKALADMAVHFEWSYVSLVSVDNAFGMDGRMDLLNEFAHRNICIDIDEYFGTPYYDKDLQRIVRKLKFRQQVSSTNVVILFLVEEASELLLKAAEDENLTGMTWILVDASGLSQWFQRLSSKVTLGMFTLAHDGGHYGAFEQYFYNLSIANGNNKWLNQFLSLNNGTTVREFQDFFSTTMAYVGLIREAIYVYGTALKNYLEANQICMSKIDVCNSNITFDREDFLIHMKNVSFKTAEGKNFTFDENGDVETVSLQIYNIQESKTNSLFLNNVGIWTSTAGLNFSQKLQWSSGSDFPPVSKCSDECGPGQYPLVDVGNQCCWVCLTCETGFVKSLKGGEMCSKCPDSLTNSNHTQCLKFTLVDMSQCIACKVIFFVLVALGVIVTLVVCITFIKFQNTPIVRSSNFRLSLLQVIAQMMLFGLLFLLYFDFISFKLCVVRMLLIGFNISFVLSLMLVKSEQLLRIFKQKVKITEFEIFKLNAIGVIVVACTTGIELTLICILLTANQFEEKVIYHYADLTKERICNVNSYLKAQMVYTVLLSIFCGIQSFRSRRLPSKYNDACTIMYAVIAMVTCVISFPALQLTSSYFYVQRFMAFLVVYIANLSIVLIMYGYKIWLIWFHPEQNTQEIFAKALYSTVVK